jgi:hypothetical protein
VIVGTKSFAPRRCIYFNTKRREGFVVTAKRFAMQLSGCMLQRTAANYTGYWISVPDISLLCRKGI